MKLTARQLNRATLGRQMLLGREPVGMSTAIGRLVALQAQQPASPYLALWNRIESFDPNELDAAFENLTVVKSTMMRITLHAALAEDYPTFREATEPTIRASRLRDRRFQASGLTEEDADRLVPAIVDAAAEPRKADALRDWLAKQLTEEAQSGGWWGLRQYTPLLRAATGGPWSFENQISYVAPPQMPRLNNEAAFASSLSALVLRYLAAFGPATIADLSQFALIPRTRIRAVCQSLADAIRRLEGPDGEELFDIPDGLLPAAASPAPPRLLGMWDNVLLAYFVRDRVIPPEYRQLIIRRNGDVLPSVLVDGYIAGIWRATEQGIEVTAFHDLPDQVWDDLADEAGTLTAFLAARDPLVYSRYNHWWDKLPEFKRRILPAG